MKADRKVYTLTRFFVLFCLKPHFILRLRVLLTQHTAQTDRHKTLKNYSSVKLTYLFWDGWNAFNPFKTSLRPNWPYMGDGGRGEGRGIDFKLKFNG